MNEFLITKVRQIHNTLPCNQDSEVWVIEFSDMCVLRFYFRKEKISLLNNNFFGE